MRYERSTVLLPTAGADTQLLLWFALLCLGQAACTWLAALLRCCVPQLAVAWGEGVAVVAVSGCGNVVTV